MSDKPIIFSAPMVRATLDGRKTQTRRIIPFNRHPEHTTLMNHPQWAGPHETCWMDQSDPVGGGYVIRRGYPVGTRLWVKEAWWRPVDFFYPRGPWKRGGTTFVRYAVDDAHTAINMDRAQYDQIMRMKPGKKSSLHMPRWASRITLEVTDVRVQRLQEISEEDAIAEGVTSGGALALPLFEAIWKKINGPGSWAANPWVWAYTFRRIKP